MYEKPVKNNMLNYILTCKGMDMRIARQISLMDKPKSTEESLGLIWWKYYVLHGFTQMDATKAANKESKTTFTRMAFANTFFRKFVENCLDPELEKAIRDLYFPDAVITNHSLFSLTSKECNITIKSIRSAYQYKGAEHFQEDVLLDENKEHKLVIFRYNCGTSYVEIYNIRESNEGEKTNDRPKNNLSKFT